MKIRQLFQRLYRVGNNPRAVLIFCLISLLAAPASAQFTMLIPSSNLIDDTQSEVSVLLSFSHPFGNAGLKLDWPEQVFVVDGASRQDLKGVMLETQFMGQQAWKFNFKPQHAGFFWLVMEQSPSWQEKEDHFVIQYGKTGLAAFGSAGGWQQPVGLKTEIVPLLRPFGNYAGNTFVGRVLRDGSPAAGAEVQVEHYNQEQWVAASSLHITQTVVADDNGVFIFTCPLPGWWGFLSSAPSAETLKGPDGKDKKVQLGAVLWAYFDPNPFTGQ